MKPSRALVGVGVSIGMYLGAFIAVGVVTAQERNRLDRPKDSQEQCGYTLKEGQVRKISDTQVQIKLDLVVESGDAFDYMAGILNGPVCAFAVDNPGVVDLRVTMHDVRSPSRFAVPIRLKPEIGSVIVEFKKK